MKRQGLARRKATEDDMDFLVALRQRTMQVHFENSGLSYEAKEQQRRILNEFSAAEIIVYDGVDIGLLKANKSTKPWHLSQIQLLPAYQGRGIGTDLIRRILAEAIEHGVGVELTVLQASPAVRLYKRLGFVVKEERAHSIAMHFDGRKPSG